MYHHDTLPLGEFAIGTNTVAYAMAQKYRDRRQASDPDRREDGTAFCDRRYVLQLVRRYGSLQSGRKRDHRKG